MNGWNHHMEEKREGQKKPKDTQPVGTKERRKLVLLVVRNYFTHSPFNVACMQIVRFNSNWRFRTNIPHQHNLPFHNKG